MDWDQRTNVALADAKQLRPCRQDGENLTEATSSDRTVAFAIIDLLEEAGVKYIFGVPGGPLTGIFEALTHRKTIRFVVAKHESGAAFMAASYARVTGQLAVCLATSGPGATNALTGIASAMCDSLPVILLTGQVSTTVFGKGAIQESSTFGVDIVSIFRPITKSSTMATDPGRIPDMLQTGIRLARSGRPGPVHLNLPANMLRAPAKVLRKVALDGVLRPAISDREVEHIANILVNASCPCIVAGHGVALSEAHVALKELAELLSAGVVTSPKGKGGFEESHPLSRGVLGFGGHEEATHLFTSEADVVLILGSSMNEFVTNAWSLAPASTATVIQVDVDPVSLGNNYKTDVIALGDARFVLEALTKTIRANKSRPVRRIVASRFTLPRDDDHGNEATLKPQALVADLREAMPDDALLFVDNGNSILWATHYFEVRQTHTYFIDLGLASMGSAVAGVVGGALGADGRHSVALVGDAAFAMHGFEVHTAVEQELPVIWIVLNDGGHGMVRHGDTLMHGAPLGVSDFRVTIDVAKFGQAMGAHADCVTNRQELRAALRAAFEHRGPTVIDARIDPREMAPSLIRRVRSLAKMLAAGESQDSNNQHLSGTFRSPLGE